jgi:ubiquinol-cytochrome c reductase cytochrome b subunit
MRKLINWLDARTDHRRMLRRIRQRVLPRGPRWWLASASCLLGLLGIEVVTGLALMATYSPSMASAWASVHYIDQSTAGRVLRGVHYYASHALIALLLAHVVRVVLTAAFRAPRDLIWLTGLLLIPLTIGWAVTGNPLSASQKRMGQIEVEARILASTPLIGPSIQRLLIGGDQPGNLTLTHLYCLHVGLLPLLAMILLAVHIAQVYRHGLAGPDEPPTGSRPALYYPHQTVRNLLVLSAIVGVILLASWYRGAPLDAPADPDLPQNPRPEWYFRWLFELRCIFAGPWEFLATIVVPLVLLLFFLLLPVIDRLLSHRGSALLRAITVGGGVIALGWLTFSSLARDWRDEQYIALERASRDLAARARLLAEGGAIPVEGAVALLHNDPGVQGPILFQRHCTGCHSHADEHGHGLIAGQPSAPNLYRFATTDWIAGLLDPDRAVLPEYFGNTKFADGAMVQRLREMFDAANTNEERAALRQKLALAARALSAQAQLPVNALADRRDADAIRAGNELIRGELGCTDCHRYGDQGELGEAPDLSDYGTRQWLADFISNPRHERFYPGEHNDRMLAFAQERDRVERNILSARELNLLVSWLRGESRHEPTAAHQIASMLPGRSSTDD